MVFLYKIMSINILTADSTRICNLPSLPEKYVRTGTLADGSCFLHAVLNATVDGYRKLTYEERHDMVTNLRESLAESVTDKELMKIANGEYRKMSFFNHLRDQIKTGFPHDNIGAMLNKIINLPRVLEETTSFKDNFYNTFIQTIENKINASAYPKKVSQNISLYINKNCYSFFCAANNSVTEEFKNGILNEDIGSKEIEFLASKLEFNFLFLKSDHKGLIYPYHEVTKVINKDWNYIVLLWVCDCHYEIIGRQNEDKTITRRFTDEDPLIQFIRANH